MQLVAGALVFDGNSLTSVASPVASQRVPYPDQTVLLFRRGIGLVWSNLAVSGQTTLDMLTRAPLVDACLSAGPANVVVAWELTNDIGHGASGIDAADHFMTYCSDRRAAGWTVVALTGTPRGKNNPPSPAAFEVERQIANTILRDTAPDYCDALVDVGATECVLGFDGADNYPRYYLDKLHLSTSGNAIVAQMVTDALVSL